MSKATVIAKLVEAGHEDLAEQLLTAAPADLKSAAEKVRADVIALNRDYYKKLNEIEAGVRGLTKILDNDFGNKLWKQIRAFLETPEAKAAIPETEVKKFWANMNAARQHLADATEGNGLFNKAIIAAGQLSYYLDSVPLLLNEHFIYPKK